MDSRAKQRLTGAIILVALFVLLVPELLTGPGKEKSSDAAKPEEGLRSYTIDLDAPTSSVQPMSAPEPAVELPPPTATNPMSPAVVETPAPTAAIPAPEPQTPAQSSTPAPRAVQTPPAAAPTVTTAPAPTVQPKPAPAQTSPARAPTTAAATTRGGFAVQLGSFSSRENAEGLVRKMTAKGFAAFIAPITSGGRELYRVRVGPTRDRPSAEALAAELHRIGESGSIVPIS